MTYFGSKGCVSCLDPGMVSWLHTCVRTYYRFIICADSYMSVVSHKAIFTVYILCDIFI